MSTERRIIIRRRLDLGYPIHDSSQRGGSRSGVQTGVITYNGFRFTYTVYRDLGTYVFTGGIRLRKKECFVLHINKDKTSELHSLHNDTDCSLDNGATAHDLIHAIFVLAKEKGSRIIMLTDGANKYLTDSSCFRLSDMYFASTGQTWFEAIANVTPVEVALVEHWRRKVLTNRWNDVFSCLQDTYPDITIPVDISDIDGMATGSAMEVFKRIKDAQTDFFITYGGNMATCSRFGPLSQITWFKEL